MLALVLIYCLFSGDPYGTGMSYYGFANILFAKSKLRKDIMYND
jgi:hypothetical protein